MPVHRRRGGGSNRVSVPFTQVVNRAPALLPAPFENFVVARVLTNEAVWQANVIWQWRRRIKYFEMFTAPMPQKHAARLQLVVSKAPAN